MCPKLAAWCVSALWFCGRVGTEPDTSSDARTSRPKSIASTLWSWVRALLCTAKPAGQGSTEQRYQRLSPHHLDFAFAGEVVDLHGDETSFDEPNAGDQALTPAPTPQRTEEFVFAQGGPRRPSSAEAMLAQHDAAEIAVHMLQHGALKGVI